MRHRQEGILVLAGGLTLNNWLDTTSFVEDTAELIYKVFDRAVLEAMTIRDVRLALSRLLCSYGIALI